MARNDEDSAPLAEYGFLRGLIEDGREVMQYRYSAKRRVIAMRATIVRRVANALVKRRRDHTRTLQNPPTLGEWLDGKNLEDTYLKSSSGYSYETRVRMSTNPIKAARHISLSLSGSPQNGSWYFRDLEKALNGKLRKEGVQVVVQQRSLSEPGYEHLTTISFEIIKLGSFAEEGDNEVEE